MPSRILSIGNRIRSLRIATVMHLPGESRMPVLCLNADWVPIRYGVPFIHRIVNRCHDPAEGPRTRWMLWGLAWARMRAANRCNKGTS